MPGFLWLSRNGSSSMAQKRSILFEHLGDHGPELVGLVARSARPGCNRSPKPALKVEIKGFKTGDSLGVKTALVGLVITGREGHVEYPVCEPANSDS
jgi:hypothetical protein